MADTLLVLNAGSSSLKFSVFLDDERPRELLRGQIEGLLIDEALKETEGNKKAAARLLGLDRAALLRRRAKSGGPE